MKCHHSQGVQNLTGLMNTETDNYNILQEAKRQSHKQGVLQEQRGSSRVERRQSFRKGFLEEVVHELSLCRSRNF